MLISLIVSASSILPTGFNFINSLKIAFLIDLNIMAVYNNQSRFMKRGEIYGFELKKD